MNFPGVVNRDPAVLAKLEAFADRVIDGHAPGLRGRSLNAYVAAGIGSDHECTTVEEAREKLRLGMTVFLREATNARNLRTLLPLVTPLNHGRLCLCTDDRQPADLLDEGHIDHLVRVTIGNGVDPMVALRMASWNTAQYFRLHDRGAITPGPGRLIVFDLAEPRPHLVFRRGRLVARDGVCCGRGPRSVPARGTMSVDWDAVDLAVAAEGTRLRVIGAVATS
jgi:adenine deaminase